MQKERDELRRQLKIVTDETLTAEEKAQRMDTLLKEEEARIYDVEKQLGRLRETQVRRNAQGGSLLGLAPQDLTLSLPRSEC